MLKFEYEIRLNDDERPYIHIPDHYSDTPEDKFMALELSRYLIINLLKLRGEELPENERKALQSAFDTLEVISDEVAMLLKQQMEVMGEMMLTVQRKYHITVDTIEDRDNLNYEGIIHKDKIYKRAIGLKVLVLKDMRVYELIEGIDNEHWKEI